MTRGLALAMRLLTYNLPSTDFTGLIWGNYVGLHPLDPDSGVYQRARGSGQYGIISLIVVSLLVVDDRNMYRGLGAGQSIRGIS